MSVAREASRASAPEPPRRGGGDDADDAASVIPARAPRSGRYLVELESLRGVAILLVFLYHADKVLVANADGPTEVSLPAAFVRAGHTGVCVFFVLSGFLLSRPFLREAGGGARVGRREYYGRRARRILPMYWLMFAVAALTQVRSVDTLLRALPFAAFLNPLARERLGSFSVGWWSLATEVQFYLVLPLLPLLIRHRAWGVAALGAYALAYGLFVAGVLAPSNLPLDLELHVDLFGRAPMFLVGIAAAWLYQAHGARLRERLAARWLAGGGADVALLAILAAQAVLLQWAAARGFWGSEVRPRHLFHVPEAILWGAVMLCLLAAPLRAKRLLVNPVLSTIGVLSYSLFLIHIPLLAWVADPIRAHFTGWSVPAALVMLGMLAACLGVSAVTYRFVERPFLPPRVDRAGASGW